MKGYVIMNTNIMKVNIMLDKISDIKEFNIKATNYNNLDLVSGKYRVPATSLMGIFSLDVTSTIRMEYPAELDSDIKEDFKKWIVD